MGNNPINVNRINGLTALLLSPRNGVNACFKKVLLDVECLVATRNDAVFIGKGFIPVVIRQNELLLFARAVLDLLRQYKVAAEF